VEQTLALLRGVTWQTALFPPTKKMQITVLLIKELWEIFMELGLYIDLIPS